MHSERLNPVSVEQDVEVVVEPVEKPSRWPYLTLGGLLLAGLLSVVAWNVELPYIAYSAGPVTDVTNSIEAEGMETFPATGELLMLTVITQNVNVFEAVIAFFDPTIDLVRRQAVRIPGETDEQYRSRVLQQMDDSNFRSILVALNELGYEMEPVEVVIDGLVEGVPAASVLEPGDTILEVQGTPVRSIAEISQMVRDLPVGEIISLKVRRQSDELDLEVELAERDDEPGVSMIGVMLGEIVEPPFDVTIRTGNVGGPSAGMMHTLAIIEALTEGELIMGQVIAGTGTVNPDGTIGAIGGVRQKVVAAEAAGARYILVPVDNYESALTAQRDRIEIVPVASIEEALEFLAGLAS